MKKLLLSLMTLTLILLTGCSAASSDLPPLPTITAGGQTIEAARGSYCWTRRCVDTISPPELIAFHKLAPAVVAPGSELTFSLDPKPSVMELDHWAPDGPVRMPLTPDGRFTAPAEAGLYVYMLHARWIAGQGSNSASYAFSIEVRK